MGMYKVFHAILKELRLLKRDLLGFAIIFLMPLVLVITITYIQHSIESNMGGIELPILLADNDKGELSQKVIENLSQSNNIKIVSKIDGNDVTTSLGKEMISTGEQRILIVIPEGFSAYIQSQTDLHVAKILSEVIPDHEEVVLEKKELKEVEIYFDPAVGANVRNSLKTAIDNMISNIETKAMYSTFEREFDTDFSFISEEKLITFTEHSLSISKQNIVPNAVQHNLPAWTLFALFFIVLPLSINMVKEKNQGTYVRLKTLPISPFYLMLSKIIVYLFVCMIQFYLMLMVSMYLFPVIGLPALEIEGKFWALSIVAFFIVLPLSINMVKEKNQGTYVRLKTLPISPFYLMLSKIIVYLFVCMIQFYLMLMVSMYLFPVIGLPALEIEGKFWALSIVAFFSGLAAIGLGVLIGTFANTHEQAAPFGATSVVILAAIGGLWFPVYAMPETMQVMAKISPMNWGLESFYHVLLRDASYAHITPYLMMLVAFFLINMVISVLYEKKINRL